MASVEIDNIVTNFRKTSLRGRKFVLIPKLPVEMKEIVRRYLRSQNIKLLVITHSRGCRSELKLGTFEYCRHFFLLIEPGHVPNNHELFHYLKVLYEIYRNDPKAVVAIQYESNGIAPFLMLIAYIGAGFHGMATASDILQTSSDYISRKQWNFLDILQSLQ